MTDELTTLRARMAAMEATMCRYLMPEPYVDADGNTREDRDAAFIGDIIFALDPPKG